MRRIIAGTLALTVLGSTWLLGAEGATKATPKKAPAKATKVVKKPVVKKAPVVKAQPPMTVAAQLQQMKGQLNQQQQQINQLQQQLQQSNQQLQSAQQQLQSGVQKADRDAMAAQQAAASAQQSANSLNSSVSDLKTTTTTISQGLAVTQKDVKELLNPLAIRYKGMTIMPNGMFAMEALYRARTENIDVTSSFNKTPLYGAAAASVGEFRMQARNSQIGFTFFGNVNEKTKLTGMWQMDFNSVNGVSQAYASQNFAPRLRHGWGRVQWGNGWAFMAGQTWSMGMVNRKLIDQFTETSPVTVDNGTMTGYPSTARIVTARLTKNFWNNKAAIAISADNSDYTLTADQATFPNTLLGVPVIGTLTLPNSPAYAGTCTAPSNSSCWAPLTTASPVAPDFWVKIGTNPGWGHYEFKGVARFFRDRLATNATSLQGQGTNTTTEGWGLGFGAIMPITKKLDVYFNGLAGAGVGRFSNSNAVDVTLSNDGHTLVPVKTVFSTVGLEFHPMPKLDVNFYVGQEYYARTQENVGPTKGGYGSVLASAGTDNKTIKEAMASIVYRWYRGPYGTFQTILQGQYWVRATWAANTTGTPPACNSSAGINYIGDNCTAKGGNSVFWLSFRYILP
ncbi:MAG: hypothetical protein ABSD88_08425 [Candidatus Korobacteraceae bacterium]